MWILELFAGLFMVLFNVVLDSWDEFDEDKPLDQDNTEVRYR